MSDPQSPEAYYLLDQTFQSAPSFNTRNSLSRQRPLSERITKSSARVESLSFADQNTAHPDPGSVSLPLVPPFAVNGHDTGLPPTPPSNSNDRSPKVTFSPAMRTGSGMSHLNHQTSTASTPLNARSPPTPDATPPASLGVPPRDSPSRMSSTRADSFKTAREDQWSSDEEEQPVKSEKSRVAALRHNMRPHRARDPSLGLKFEEEEEESENLSRTISRSSKTRRNLAEDKEIRAEPLAHIPNREWDTNLMRNVTVRRKKPPHISRHAIQDDESRVKEREIVPKLVTGSSEEEDLEPTTPHLSEFGQAIGWPKATGQTRIRDNDSKRLSDQSNPSTLVEAIVIATPPQRRRTLRHVSRNLSLRSDAGDSVTRSPSPRSTRTSLRSEEIFSRYPTHKSFSASGNSPRGSGNSDMLMNGKPITTRTLKHHHDNLTLRADAIGDRKHEKQQDSPTVGASPHRRVVSASLPSRQSSISDGTRHRMSSLQNKPPVSHGSPKSQVDGPIRYSMRRSDMDKRRESHPTRMATQRALRQVDGLAFPPEPKIRRASIDEQMQTRKQASARLDILEAYATPTKPALKQTVLSTADNVAQRPSIEATTSEELRRVSFDTSTIGTHEFSRSSMDHSLLRPDEHAGRPLLTPFSETSDHQLEISEATAVNLYPHNNNSLLVVQQQARPSEVQRAGADDLDIPGWPVLTVQPATPPTQSTEIVNVDSPLRHPRKPPQPPLQPPAIRILPATPNQEIESPLDDAELRPEPPKRSLSFKEHALQFSQTLTQPMFPRTASYRRSAHRRKRDVRHSEPARGKDPLKANTLHPFWQPRGFWDDFSDSDSEYDGAEEGGSARLPPGGDTSDIVESRNSAPPRTLTTRVLEGFRGSGGFLIGNSLGVERAGSNKRRHHVSVPAGLGRRTSGHVVRRTSEGTLRSLRSLESLSRKGQGKVRRWNPKNWRVHYIGVSGIRDLWKERQADKRREKLRQSIGVKYVVEGAPVV